MDDEVQPVNVRYGLGPAARQAFAKALGHMDVNNYPPFPNVPDLAYVPSQGDLLTWEAVPDVIFKVQMRVFRALRSGALQIQLMVDVDDGT